MSIEKWDAATYPFWHGSAPMSHVLGVAGPAEVLVSGDGSWVVDRGGRRFLDARAGIANMMLGYSRSDIVAAMNKQALELPFVCTFRYERPAGVIVDYARSLVAVAPSSLTRVRFTHTGSAAVESALLMARCYHRNLGHPDKVAIIGLAGSYHGSTLMTMAAAGQPYLHDAFGPMPEGFHHVPPPAAGACGECLGTDVAGPNCVDDVFERIAAIGPERVAAIIVEPIKGLSGVPLPSHYLKALRELCSRHDILMIFDEVFSGFGRMGPMFVTEQVGVEPDIMCLSKGVTSGYAALGAVLTTDPVYQAFDRPGLPPFSHGSSTDAHPISCAAGLAVLGAYATEEIVTRGRRMGDRLSSLLAEGLAGNAAVGGIRHVGGFVAIDLVDEDGKPASMTVMRHLQAECESRGLFIDYTPEIVMLVPPLTSTDGDIDRIVGTVAETVGATRESDIDTSLLRPPSVSGRR
jgi:adenosylmethionine-8-amino-7-oxononanoate aminotransferase